MVDTSVNEWGGLALKNPIVIASSSLGNNIEKLRRFDKAGAGAVITKVISRRSEFPKHIHKFPMRAAISGDNWLLMGEPRIDVDYGARMIKQAKKELRIPVIANMMGLHDNTDVWVDVGLKLQKAGAAALELDLNSASVNDTCNQSHGKFKKIKYQPQQVGKVVKAMNQAIDIPVIPKLTPTPMEELIPTCESTLRAGGKSVTIANVLGGLTGIDIENGGKPVYQHAHNHNPLPYCGSYLRPIHNLTLAMLIEGTKGKGLSFSSGGGIMSWEHAVERILLGADTVQLCSALYLKGLRAITDTLNGLELYMEKYGYKNLKAMRGKGLAYYTPVDPQVDPCVAKVAEPLKCLSCNDPCVEKVQADCLAMTMGSQGVPGIDTNLCTGCSLCYWHCADGAIEMIRTKKHNDYRVASVE